MSPGVDRVEFMADESDGSSRVEPKGSGARRGTDVQARPQHIEYAMERLTQLSRNHAGRDESWNRSCRSHDAFP
jgi:hypothetical protein